MKIFLAILVILIFVSLAVTAQSHAPPHSNLKTFTANAQVFDPPARELSKEDWDEVYGKLNQTRDSFRFRKSFTTAIVCYQTTDILMSVVLFRHR